MEDIELRIGNITTRVSCEDPQKLLNMTNKVNERVNKLKKENNISDTKALFIISIYLVDEIENINEELQKLKAKFYDQFENEKKTISKSYEEIIDRVEEITNHLKESSF